MLKIVSIGQKFYKNLTFNSQKVAKKCRDVAKLDLLLKSLTIAFFFQTKSTIKGYDEKVLFDTILKTNIKMTKSCGT